MPTNPTSRKQTLNLHFTNRPPLVSSENSFRGRMPPAQASSQTGRAASLFSLAHASSQTGRAASLFSFCLCSGRPLARSATTAEIGDHAVTSYNSEAFFEFVPVDGTCVFVSEIATHSYAASDGCSASSGYEYVVSLMVYDGKGRY